MAKVPDKVKKSKGKNLVTSPLKSTNVTKIPAVDIFGILGSEGFSTTVIDAPPGAGKTEAVVEWLARFVLSGKSDRNRVILALPTVDLCCEVSVRIHKKLRTLSESGIVSKSCVAHASRHIEKIFSIKPNHIESMEKDLHEANSDDKKALAIAKLQIAGFIKDRRNTRLTKERCMEIVSSRLVITTHESLKTLGISGFTKGADIIIDEAPECFVGDVRHGGSDAVDAILAQAGQTDLRHFPSASIANALKDGFMKYKTVTYNCGDREVVRTAFYVDVDKFKANSLLMMSAEPGGTAIKVLELLGESPFLYYIHPESKRIKDALASRTNSILLGKGVSCSSSSHDSGKVEAARKLMIKVAQEYIDNGLWVSHLKYQPKGLSCISLNCVGKNTYNNRNYIFLDGLTYDSPEDAIFWGSVLGDCRYTSFFKAKQVTYISQSIMRGSPRVPTSGEFAVISYDRKPLQAWAVSLDRDEIINLKVIE